MKKALFKTMVCVGAAGMFLSSCTNEDLYNPNAVIEKYEQNWEKTFGKIDPNQSWNTAKQVVANISIGYEGDYVAKIYTANPRNKDAETYLLGKFEVEGGTTSSLKPS